MANNSRSKLITEGVRAQEILQPWEAVLPRFVRVIPNDYRQVIEAQKHLLSNRIINRKSGNAGVYGEIGGLECED